MTETSDRKAVSLPDGDSPWMRVWQHEGAAAVPEPAAPARAPRVEREGLRPGALGPWWAAGLRAATFRPVQGLDALQATPAVVAWLVVFNLLVQVLWQRLATEGPANFHWQGLLQGGLDLAVLAWICAWVSAPGPGRIRLLCLVLGIDFVVSQSSGLLWVLVSQAQATGLLRDLGMGLIWLLWLGPMVWELEGPRPMR